MHILGRVMFHPLLHQTINTYSILLVPLSTADEWVQMTEEALVCLLVDRTEEVLTVTMNMLFHTPHCLVRVDIH